MYEKLYAVESVVLVLIMIMTARTMTRMMWGGPAAYLAFPTTSFTVSFVADGSSSLNIDHMLPLSATSSSPSPHMLDVHDQQWRL